MKFLRTQKGGHGVAAFAFQMSREELDWLLATLRLYPMLPGDYHQITISNAEELKAGQSLLEEAMAQQRADHKQKLDRFLASPGRFRVEGPDLYRFNVTGDQLEWLLQILNDVRVGCWVKLGKPELEAARRQEYTSQQARQMLAMEYSGFFQMALLQALKGPEDALPG